MSRDSSGNYSLPSSPLVDGTIADAVPVQNNFSDIATALTQSIASTGVTPITAAIKFFAGTSAAPGITFATDATTGLELLTSGTLGFSAGGVQVGQISSGGWAGMTLNSPTISAPTFVNSGTAGITGLVLTTPTINGSVGGEISFSAVDQIVLPVGSTGARPGSPTAGGVRYNSSTNLFEYWNGTIWIQPGKPPTYTSKTSTGSGTYTPPTGCVYIKVRMSAAGGAGGASNASGQANNGGNTSFASWTTVSGSGGIGGGTGIGAGGIGGNGGTNGAGTVIIRISGGNGGGGGFEMGGCGGNNPFSGAGGGGSSNIGAVPTAAKSNTGGGGAGDSLGSAVGAAGGGAGEYVEFLVSSPTAVGFSVGTGGVGSGGGTNGGSGVIVIEEFYA